MTRLGDDSDEKSSTLRGDCLAGAYTASVILYDRKDTSGYHVSPGDLVTWNGKERASIAPEPSANGYFTASDRA